MGLPNVFQTGRSSMQAAKAAIATSGHNVANANTEGYSRQRVEMSASTPRAVQGSNALIGDGVHVSKVSRINDDYIEKQIRNSTRDVSHMEERDLALKQTEDIFNEMNGEGLNRIMTRFFNEFRKLGNEPDNQAVRESVREASKTLVNDFKRLRREVDEVRQHIDARLEGYAKEVNSMTSQLATLNRKIHETEITGVNANDMQDQRDVLVKKLSGYMDLQIHKDGDGNVNIEIPKIGPLVVGIRPENFSTFRSPADNQGKVENSLDVESSGTVADKITHDIKGGKIGALIETRDETLSTILGRLDDLAYSVSESVNSVHSQGFTRNGTQNVAFFKQLGGKDRASEYIDLSDAVKEDVNNIATAAQADAPSDNRIALGIAGIQHARVMNGGKSTVDDYYNSIISDVGVASSQNRNNLNQQRDIMTQLNKMRDQVSGVSIDEETANLMQFQHTFDASAKIIQVADEMLKTVLELKR